MGGKKPPSQGYYVQKLLDHISISGHTTGEQHESDSSKIHSHTRRKRGKERAEGSGRDWFLGSNLTEIIQTPRDRICLSDKFCYTLHINKSFPNRVEPRQKEGCISFWWGSWFWNAVKPNHKKVLISFCTIDLSNRDDFRLGRKKKAQG